MSDYKEQFHNRCNETGMTAEEVVEDLLKAKDAEIQRLKDCGDELAKEFRIIIITANRCMIFAGVLVVVMLGDLL